MHTHTLAWKPLSSAPGLALAEAGSPGYSRGRGSFLQTTRSHRRGLLLGSLRGALGSFRGQEAACCRLNHTLLGTGVSAAPMLHFCHFPFGLSQAALVLIVGLMTPI